MGIRSLSSIINQNAEMSPHHKLRETRLVIDGQNLLSRLYFNSDLDITRGGDYDEVAKLIRIFFLNLRKCDIIPIVVLDGGTDPSDRKNSLLIKRMTERLKAAHEISMTGVCHEQQKCLLPCLTELAFVTILKEEGIDVLQAEFEADEEMVVIANHYQCPVLSNDSEFYFCDLEGGFVRLDSLVNIIHTSEHEDKTRFFIPCKLYFLKNLMAYFPGLKKELMPMCSALLGNDYILPETFEVFFKKINVAVYQIKRISYNTRNIGHTRIVRLLSWMENQTYDEVLNQVMNSIKLDSREEVLELIGEVKENYLKNSSPLLEYLLNSNTWEPTTMNKKVISKMGNVPPMSLLKKIHLSDLDRKVLNVLCSRRIRNSPVIGEPKSPSCHSCAAKIRLALYKVLLNVDGFGNYIVQEDDHENWQFVSNLIKVTYDNTEVPTLTELSNLDVIRRRQYLMQSVECEDMDLNVFPANLQLPIVVLSFFLKNTTLPFSEEFVHALLCSLVLLGMIRPSIVSTQNLSGRSEDLIRADNSLSKYLVAIKPIIGDVFMSDVVHRHNEYQVCLQRAFILNQLLGNPLPIPKFHECLNGTFIYNLVRVLKTQPSPDRFVADLLGRGSTFDVFYQSAKDFLGIEEKRKPAYNV